MKVRLIRLGNSRVLPLPNSLIERCGFGEQAEVRVRGRVLEVSPVRKLREGWEKSFKEMAHRGDDALLL